MTNEQEEIDQKVGNEVKNIDDLDFASPRNQLLDSIEKKGPKRLVASPNKANIHLLRMRAGDREKDYVVSEAGS